jgi:hypothetical protein
VKKDVTTVIAEMSAESRQDVALANAGFTPQNRANSAAGMMRLPCQSQKFAIRSLVDALNVRCHVIRVADPVCFERIRVI